MMSLSSFLKAVGLKHSASAHSPKPTTVDQESPPAPSGKPSQSCSTQILRACSTNDISTLRTLFQRLNITGPHPEIIYSAGYQPQPSDPPWTSEMLTAAVREQHDPIVKFLLKLFPDTKIRPGVAAAALVYRDIVIWTRLLKHDPSFLSDERDESQSTPFSQACWGSEPDLPLLMLKYGADPNTGGFGHMSNLTIGMKEQPMKLIKQLVRDGAELRGELFNAVFYKRVDAVRYLLDNGGAPTGIHGDVMAEAMKGGSEDIIRILRTRGGQGT